MNFALCKRWVLVALVGLVSMAGVSLTAIPTAQADGHYREHEVRVVRPGYGHGYEHRGHVNVYGGGPRIVVPVPAPYYRRHRDHHHYYGNHRGTYYHY